jgi:glutamyl-tRNA reductase
VKRAYELACAHGAAGATLHRLFQEAIGAAKRVRRETGIDEGRLSVGSVAVDLVRQVFSRFDDKSVLAIGAGQMMKLTLRHVRALSPERLWLVNRTPARALALAQALDLSATAGGVVRPWDELNPLLGEADIVISSTGASRPIVTAEGFRAVARRRRGRPLCVIDIAVPRDFEAGVGEYSDVYLYNIDDLQRVVTQTQDQRRSQAQRAEELLDASVRACVRQVQHDDVGRIVRKLRRLLHDLGRAECERTARKLAAEGAPGAQPHMEELTHRLINKVLHLPLSKLRGREGDEHLDFYALALRRLFELDAVEIAETDAAGDGSAELPAGEPPPAELPTADAKPLS